MAMVRRGLSLGLATTWKLAKILFPITLIITFLSYTAALDWLIAIVTPFMNLIGLPGDAAIPLVLGATLNIYAAVGAALSLSFTVKEMFIIAMMVSFCHNIFVETGVGMKLGAKAAVIVSVRLGLALTSAVLINWLWSGGKEMAVSGGSAYIDASVTGFWEILSVSVQKAVGSDLQVMKIILPLMVLIQIMREKNWLLTFSEWMAPVTRFLGLEKKHSLTLVSGMSLGFVYGAGIMLDAAKEDKVNHEDITKIVVILIASHAMFEDTLIFIPLGIPIVPLFSLRMLTAMLVAFVYAKVIGRRNLDGEKDYNITV